MRIILASASPRRKELLSKLFRQFEIMPAAGEEACAKESPDEVVMELSFQKAAEAERAVLNETAPGGSGYLVIGADTVVASGGKILGKPRDEEDARSMLHMLSGNVHQVYTGVTLILADLRERECIKFAECTDVTFYPMSEAEIRAYVRTGEPMDKAGSYGIQGMGGRFVEKINGDYNNVVGLPSARIYQILKEHGMQGYCLG